MFSCMSKIFSYKSFPIYHMHHQAPRSGRRSFPLSLTAADRPFEIFGRYSDHTSFDNRITSLLKNHSLFPDFAKFLHFLRGLTAASRENFEHQTLFGAWYIINFHYHFTIHVLNWYIQFPIQKIYFFKSWRRFHKKSQV